MSLGVPQSSSRPEQYEGWRDRKCEARIREKPERVEDDDEERPGRAPPVLAFLGVGEAPARRGRGGSRGRAREPAGELIQAQCSCAFPCDRATPKELVALAQNGIEARPLTRITEDEVVTRPEVQTSQDAVVRTRDPDVLP